MSDFSLYGQGFRLVGKEKMLTNCGEFVNIEKCKHTGSSQYPCGADVDRCMSGDIVRAFNVNNTPVWSVVTLTFINSSSMKICCFYNATHNVYYGECNNFRLKIIPNCSGHIVEVKARNDETSPFVVIGTYSMNECNSISISDSDVFSSIWVAWGCNTRVNPVSYLTCWGATDDITIDRMKIRDAFILDYTITLTAHIYVQVSASMSSPDFPRPLDEILMANGCQYESYSGWMFIVSGLVANNVTLNGQTAGILDLTAGFHRAEVLLSTPNPTVTLDVYKLPDSGYTYENGVHTRLYMHPVNDPFVTKTTITVSLSDILPAAMGVNISDDQWKTHLWLRLFGFQVRGCDSFSTFIYTVKAPWPVSGDYSGYPIVYCGDYNMDYTTWVDFVPGTAGPPGNYSYGGGLNLPPERYPGTKKYVFHNVTTGHIDEFTFSTGNFCTVSVDCEGLLL